MACPSCGVATFGDGVCAGCKADPKPAPAAQPESGEPPPMPSPDDFVGRMIPTGNKPALISYYVAYGSLIPCLGVVAAVVAVIYGIKGIHLERRYPEVRGGLHAWFGVIFSLLCVAGQIAVAFLMAASTRR